MLLKNRISSSRFVSGLIISSSDFDIRSHQGFILNLQIKPFPILFWSFIVHSPLQSHNICYFYPFTNDSVMEIQHILIMFCLLLRRLISTVAPVHARFYLTTKESYRTPKDTHFGLIKFTGLRCHFNSRRSYGYLNGWYLGSQLFVIFKTISFLESFIYFFIFLKSLFVIQIVYWLSYLCPVPPPP